VQESERFRAASAAGRAEASDPSDAWRCADRQASRVACQGRRSGTPGVRHRPQLRSAP